MFVRAAALVLPVTLTLSLAWSPTSFIGVFPFMLPAAVLLIGARYRVDAVPISFMALAALAAISAIVTGAALGYAYLWLGLTLLYLVARHRLLDVLPPRTMARTLGFCACAVGLLALYQYSQGTTWGTPYTYADAEMKLGLTTVGGTLVQRPVGVFHNSNMLGQWVLLAALLLLPVLRFTSRTWRLAVVGVAFAVLGLTYSRAVWGIGVVVAVLVVLRWTSRSAARVATLCIAGAATGFVLMFTGPPGVPQEALPDRFGAADLQENLQLRERLNAYGLDIAGEDPLTGVGYLQFPTSLGGDEDLRPHNVFIQVAAEQGFPAAVVLGWVLCVSAFTCWRAARRSRFHDAWLSGALVALPLAWAGFLLVYSSAADYAVMPLFVTALGYLLALADRLDHGGHVGSPVEQRTSTTGRDGQRDRERRRVSN